MRFFGSDDILGLVLYMLISRTRYNSISYDALCVFQFKFLKRINKVEQSFLRISRDDVIKFCDENKDWVYFDRNLERIVVKELTPESGFHFFWEYGKKVFYNQGNEADGKKVFEEAFFALDEAMKEEK